MNFNPELLTNEIIWVRCSSTRELSTLGDWAEKNGLRRPAICEKNEGDSYYYNIPKAAITNFLLPHIPAEVIRFEDLIAWPSDNKFKSGDLVRWPPLGDGKVTAVNPVGRMHVQFEMALVIFYKVPSDLERAIDWSTVKPGTKCTAGSHIHFFQFFAGGFPWFSLNPIHQGTVKTLPDAVVAP